MQVEVVQRAVGAHPHRLETAVAAEHAEVVGAQLRRGEVDQADPEDAHQRVSHGRRHPSGRRITPAGGGPADTGAVTSAPTLASPLLDLPGAVPAAGPDAGVALHYGDPIREQRALARAAGWVDRGNRGVIAVPGADRLSWLHSVTSQHLSALADGTGTEGLVLSPHGHVEQHFVAAELAGTTWLDTEPGAVAGLLAYLDSMRFLLRVEPRDATAELAVLTVAGPAAPAPR